jgi:hypothetical protein
MSEKFSLSRLCVECFESSGSSYLDVEKVASRFVSAKDEEKNADGKKRQNDDSKILGPYCMESAAHVKKSLAAIGHIGPELQDSVVLLIKLGLCLVAYGVDTPTSEEILHNVSIALSVPDFHIEYYHATRLEIRLGIGPLLAFSYGSGFISDKASSVLSIAKVLQNLHSDELSQHVVTEAIALVDEVIESKPLFRPFWDHVAQWNLVAWACIVFGGNWQDFVITMVVNTVLTFARIAYSRLSPSLATLSTILDPLLLGVFLSAIRFHIPDRWAQDECHMVSVWEACLWRHLPGAGLIMGAAEVKRGNLSLGTARFLSGCIKCMYLAVAFIIGWQAFGYNGLKTETWRSHVWDIEGTHTASIPPSKPCEAQFDWQIYYGVLSIPFFIFFMASTSVRFSHMPLTFVALWGTWMFYGWVVDAPKALPASGQNVTTFFVGMIVAYILDMQFGIPSHCIKMMLVQTFAPGALGTRSIVRKIVVEDEGRFSLDVFAALAINVVTYTLGDYIAEVLMTPLKHMKIRGAMKKAGLSFVGCPRHHHHHTNHPHFHRSFSDFHTMNTTK